MHARLLATACMTYTVDTAEILCKRCAIAAESSSNDVGLHSSPVVLICKHKEALCVGST